MTSTARGAQRSHPRSLEPDSSPLARHAASRPARRSRRLALLLPALVVGCGDSSPVVQSEAACLATNRLANRMIFASASQGATILAEPDDWALQLSAFERSARRGTTDATSLREFLAFVASATLDWTPAEEAYWRDLLNQLSVAVGGLNLMMPSGFMIKTTGEEEFGAVYARQRSIILPQGRLDVAGNDRRDFFLLAHELFHLLSTENPGQRRALYALLGFERVQTFTYPPELEDRRLSNPGAAHWYEHALRVETNAGSVPVVPVLQAAMGLEPFVQTLGANPRALFEAIDVVLLPVDPASGAVLRDDDGAIIRYGLQNTDWRARLRRNSSYIIHPEELMADNFALLMESRRSGSVPSVVPGGPGEGTAVTDTALLRAVEEVLTAGCRDEPAAAPAVTRAMPSFSAPV